MADFSYISAQVRASRLFLKALKYERGINTAEAEAIGHHCVEDYIILALAGNGQILGGRIEPTNIGRSTDEVVFHHQ